MMMQTLRRTAEVGVEDHKIVALRNVIAKTEMLPKE
jgi:hypothetical protein